MKKVIFAIILLSFFSFCGAAAYQPQQEEAAPESEFQFDIQTNTITGYTGERAELVIPAVINGYPVKRLGNSLFYSNNTLKHVTISEGVQIIEANVFYFNENLETIVLPSTLESIDSYAFFSCRSLQEITFPAKLSFIAKNAFQFVSKLKKITFLGNPPLIAQDAFDLSENLDVAILVPNETQSAYEEIFSFPCTPNGENDPISWLVSDADLEIDPSGTITAYTGDSTYLIFPEKVRGIDVKQMGEKVFFGNKGIRRIEMPATMKRIDGLSFVGSGLVDIILPEGLKEIGDQAFMGCPLIRLNLPKSLTQLGKKAFYGVTIEDVLIPTSLAEIPAGTFANCINLEYLIFQDAELPKIDPTAFEKSPIADIDIVWNASKADAEKAKALFVEHGFDPESFSVWRADRPDQAPYPAAYDFAFDDASGFAVSYTHVPEEMTMFWNFESNTEAKTKYPVKGIGVGLFKNSAIKRFDVPHSDNFEVISDRAFAGSALETIHLFDSVTTIGDFAFADCQNLREITIPASVQTIGANAFTGCSQLETVIFEGDSLTFGVDAFKDCAALKSLILPVESAFVGELGLDHDFIRFADEATPEQLERMATALQYPWYAAPLRVSDVDPFVKMPDSYIPNSPEDFEFDVKTGTIKKYIGEAGQVVIPREIDGVPVQKIDFLAFSDMSVMNVYKGEEYNETLSSIIIPETVRAIEDSAFVGNKALGKIECYGPLDRIGIRAFEECSSLKEANFINGVREMDTYAFNLNSSLEQVNFAGKLKVLPEGAFYGCGFSGEVTLDYEEIGQGAFWKCENISTLRITPRVKKIGPGAFAEMKSLEKVYFENPDVSILGESEFQFSTEIEENLQIILPLTASDKQVNDFVLAMKKNAFLDVERMVVRE